MDYAFAVIGIGISGATICEVERVENELHILMCVLLLVACKCLPELASMTCILSGTAHLAGQPASHEHADCSEALVLVR